MEMPSSSLEVVVGKTSGNKLSCLSILNSELVFRIETSVMVASEDAISWLFPCTGIAKVVAAGRGEGETGPSLELSSSGAILWTDDLDALPFGDLFD